MKRILILTCITTLILLSTTSCKKFLDTKPTDFLSAKIYYETESQLNSALAGVYNVLGTDPLYAQFIPVWFANEGDEGYFGSDTRTIGPQVHNYSPGEPRIEQTWKALYEGIGYANLLLANVDKNMAISRDIRNRVRGEALFLRAYYYFLLVQLWGDVPLLLEPTTSAENLQVPQTPAKEVYERILVDMEEAEGLVSSIIISGSGKVNKSAVRGILARVNLYMAGYPIRDVSKYADARDWAKKVIDDTEAAHALNPDFKQVFINYAQDKYDLKESIFEIEFFGNTVNAYNETGRIGAYIGIKTTNSDIGSSYGFIYVTTKLYRSYEDSDVRRDWTIAPFTYNNNTGDKKYFTSTSSKDLYERNVGKYRREYEVVTPKANYTGPINWPLLRYSDVLLMYAEALSEIAQQPTTDALKYLNEVRNRANASKLNETDIPDLISFKEVLYAERSRELAFEGLRKADLIRWGELVPIMKGVLNDINTDYPNAYFALKFKNASKKDLLFPIPSREFTLNKALVQNPNW